MKGIADAMGSLNKTDSLKQLEDTIDQLNKTAQAEEIELKKEEEEVTILKVTIEGYECDCTYNSWDVGGHALKHVEKLGQSPGQGM